MNALILGLAVLVAAPAPKEAPKATPKFEGKWIVETVEGPKEKEQKTVIFTFAEGKIIIHENGVDKADGASYTLDMKKNPVEIDIQPEKGGKGTSLPGIIEVKGDTIKLCFSFDGSSRPKDFKGSEEKGVMMITLKRAKAEK